MVSVSRPVERSHRRSGRPVPVPACPSAPGPTVATAGGGGTGARARARAQPLTGSSAGAPAAQNGARASDATLAGPRQRPRLARSLPRVEPHGAHRYIPARSDGSFTGTVRTATLLLPVEICLDPGRRPTGPTTGSSRRARPSSGSAGTRRIRSGMVRPADPRRCDLPAGGACEPGPGPGRTGALPAAVVAVKRSSTPVRPRGDVAAGPVPGTAARRPAAHAGPIDADLQRVSMARRRFARTMASPSPAAWTARRTEIITSLVALYMQPGFPCRTHVRVTCPPRSALP